MKISLFKSKAPFHDGARGSYTWRFNGVVSSVADRLFFELPHLLDAFDKLRIVNDNYVLARANKKGENSRL
jgi:hypothetical protein